MGAHIMRPAHVLRLVTFALVLAAGTARGQEPAPAQIGSSALDAGGAVELVLPWRFRAGDDPRWAAPDLPDGEWRTFGPRMPPGGVPVGGWSGTGWFRRHLRVDKAIWATPLALRVVAPGSSEVYLDGKVVGRFGPTSVGASRAASAPPIVVFSGQAEHLLAVRYSLPDVSPLTGPGLDFGFYLTLEEPESVLAVRANAVRRSAAFQVALTVIPLLLGFLHLGLFAFYPKARENLFYALNMLAFAVIVFSDSQGVAGFSIAGARSLGRFSTVAAVAAILFGLFTYYALRTRRFPRSWVLFALLAPVPVAIGVVSTGQIAGWCWVPFFAATVVEIVRIEASGKTVRPQGGRTLFWGLLVIYGAVALQAVINVGLIPRPFGEFRQVYMVSILAAAVSMSLFLARSFAQTRVHLERRLEEVQALSGQLLEQERAAHARELEQKLLEAENARKTAELEAARALQLSMLPLRIPEVEGLDVAVAMTTASEVGGDTYDFRTGPDGALVVAVGDATGHGVAAGTMVAAVKALFTALGGWPDLAAMLTECDRVLRGMNVQPLHMCLTVARIAPRSLEMCSAAMPPVLIWRAHTGEVAEIGVGGLPLGGRLSPQYRQQRTALEAGDTLLFATDGLPELLDGEDRALGFAGAAEALRGSAGGAAEQVVERLLTKVAAWRGERELADDITFVVVRVER